MQILEHPISREELKAIAQNTFGDMVKCVADIRLGLLSIDADLHADLEACCCRTARPRKIFGDSTYGWKKKAKSSLSLILSSTFVRGKTIRPGIF